MGDLEREEAHRRICAVFDLCRAEGTPRGARDATLLSLLFGARLTPDRVVRLPVAAYDPGTGRLRVPDGPSPRARSGARETLGAWLAHRGGAPGPLVCRLGAGARALPVASGDEAPTGPGSLRLDVGDVDRILARRARAVELHPPALWAARRLYRSPWWDDPRDPPR